MLAYVLRSFWSIPRNIGWGLCQSALQSRAEQSRAEQSRAEVIQPSSLSARRTVSPTNGPALATVVWNTNGKLCSKKKHVSPHFLGMPEKCEEKVLLFRNLNLTLRNNESILYRHCPRRALQFAREFENRARMFVASPKHTI